MVRVFFNLVRRLYQKKKLAKQIKFVSKWVSLFYARRFGIHPISINWVNTSESGFDICRLIRNLTCDRDWKVGRTLRALGRRLLTFGFGRGLLSAGCIGLHRSLQRPGDLDPMPSFSTLTAPLFLGRVILSPDAGVSYHLRQNTFSTTVLFSPKTHQLIR